MEKDMKKVKKERVIILMLIIIILILGLIICFLLKRPGKKADEPVSEVSEIVEKNQGTISVPGYESLDLTAGQREQNLALPNPPENNCIFVFTLSLADGTVLWESEDVLPGKQSSRIILQDPLEAGSYENALLHVDCFTADEARFGLNNADIKLTLVVK